MKTKSLNRFLALSVVSILALMAVAPSVRATSVPSSEPVYVDNCAAVGAPATFPSNIMVFFNLNNQAGLTKFLDDAYYNPYSPSYHDFLSADQFDDQYSAPSWVFGIVNSIMASNGLTTIASAPMLIEASGTHAEVDNVLTQLAGTASIQKYIIGAECMPETIDAQSLNNKQIPSNSPTYVRGAYVGNSPYSGSKPSSCTYTESITITYDTSKTTPGLVWFPCGLQTIYDENPLLNNDPHQTIALVDGFGDPDPTAAASLSYVNLACSDLAIFDTTFSLPNSGCSVVYPTGVPVLSPYNVADAEGWSTETAIDMQYAHTMAPQAHILEVTSSTDWDDLYASIEYVVNNQLANMISLSWGSFEDGFYCVSYDGCSPPNTAALMLGYDEIFQQAAAEGIGVFASSGDSAAYDLGLGEVSALNPASDPWVSGVGGTTLTATFTSHTVSRLETAWSLGSDPYGPNYGTGGGFSMIFREPLGQQLVHISTQVSSIPEPAVGTGITFYPQGQRGVPDLAAEADPSTGVLIIQDGTFSPYSWGGTSLSAPLTAGMTALIQGSNRYFTIGDLAPTLYQLYSQEGREFYVHQTTFSLFDLSRGVQGTMFETASGQNGEFQVTPGVWNPVAGLGQLNVYGLSQEISPFGFFH